MTSQSAHAKLPISAIPSMIWLALAGMLIAWGGLVAKVTADMGTLKDSMEDIRTHMATQSDIGAMGFRVQRLEQHDDNGRQTEIDVGKSVAAINENLKNLRSDLERTERIAERAHPSPQFFERQ